MRIWIRRLLVKILEAYCFVVRPHMYGVVCVVRRDKQVLLVRHTYRDLGEWVLPAGLRWRWQDAEAIMLRELHHELGLTLEHLRPLCERIVAQSNRTICLSYFTVMLEAREDIGPIKHSEIAEVGWFLPAEWRLATGPETLEILELIHEQTVAESAA